MQQWNPIPKSEIERLAKTLRAHIREINKTSNFPIHLDKDGRISFTESLLRKQSYTCAFGGGNSKYCWNRVQNNHLSYLKLEWAHKNPSVKGTTENNLDNLYLLCGRCNNQLQTSLQLAELLEELEYKIQNIRTILK